MDLDLFSCTFEKLNNLKFNDLRKLSSQYQIKKKWAKKRELIDKLLLLRDQEIEKRSLVSDGTDKVVECSENMEWVDGKKFLSSVEVNEPDINDRRLTYNVTRTNSETVDRRLTFNVVKEKEIKPPLTSVPAENNIVFDRRLTYNTSDLKKIQENSKFALETCNTEKAMQQHNNPTNIKEESETDIITTYPANKVNTSSTATSGQLVEEKCIVPNEKSNISDHKMNVEMKGKRDLGKPVSQTSKSTQPLHPKVKMLTIPFSGIGQNRRGTTKDSKANDNFRLKISEKSVNIKKPTVRKTDVAKIHQVLQQKNNPQLNKFSSLSKSVIADKNYMLQKSEKKVETSNTQLKKGISGFDENKRILRRKSKTEDNVLVKNLNPARNLKFYSPRESDLKTKRLLKSPHRLESALNKSRIPKPTTILPVQKPITAIKMPDFSKIHKKRFEQMDSLYDYQKKKEERAKKLFGIPQPGIPVSSTGPRR